MQRGVVPLALRPARARAGSASPAALPTVLELLDDPDPATRKEAIRAARRAARSRAASTAAPSIRRSAALADAATPIDEKIELVRLLGRTGAPRAQAVLLPLTPGQARRRSGSPCIEALGLRCSAGSADRRQGAARGARRRVARRAPHTPRSRSRAWRGAAAVAALLDRLTVAAEQDRGALGIALSGALARATEAALADRVRDGRRHRAGRRRATRSSRGSDACAAPTRRRALDALAAGGIDDRRKVAEALGGHPEARGERCARSRATRIAACAPTRRGRSAPWAARRRSRAPHRAPADPDVAVAGNAAAALGRLAAREKDPTLALPRPSAPPLEDARPYVRANALEASPRGGAACEPAALRDLVLRDSSSAVRRAAADAVRATLVTSSDAAVATDAKRALARCAGEDRDASVAASCTSAPIEAGHVREDVTVYVVPDGGSTPLGRAPYALLRTDGFLRLGVANRRGELFELGLPRGAIRLAVPAALAR